MFLINLLTAMLAKAYRKEAERRHNQAQKAAAAHDFFKEEAAEYRRRAEEAELAAGECLSAQVDSLNAREAHYDKAEEIERFFTV